MNQQPFFKLNEPLSEQNESLLAEIESLPPDRQQDAIAILFGAMVSEYKAAPEKANPFVKFFAQMAIVQDFDQKPQQSMTATACESVKICTSIENFSGSQLVNQ